MIDFTNKNCAEVQELVDDVTRVMHDLESKSPDEVRQFWIEQAKDVSRLHPPSNDK